ncbi:MAG TPA: hypothetical protein VE964_15340 [Myxococcales bacterium]|nr:hypothetical protein [Myxococcales bacterium]
MAHHDARPHAPQFARSFCLLALCLSAGLPVAAKGTAGPPEPFTGVSIKVLNSSSPPGGVIQFLVTLTEPKPIVMATAAITIDTGVVGPVMGVALYGPTAATSDAIGAAVPSATGLTVRTISPSGTFGTDANLPILAVTLGVPPDAQPGTHASLLLDPAASVWIDPFGQPYAQQIKDGNFVVGGAVAITDVFPGMGLLPAGSSVVVRGLGFQPGAIVEIDGVSVAATSFVSSSEVDAILGVDADLYGRRVRVRNPDFSTASYRSYLRATWLGRSANPLLASTDPIWSPQTFTGAFFTTAPGPGQFLALALQNPAADSADVSVELRSTAAGSIATTTLTLPPRTRISRQVAELFAGVPLPADAFLVVRSISPVQMLGLLGDDAAGTVEPVVASLAFP